MEIVGMLLMGVGFILAIAGAIWFLVIAFQESVWWGLGCLFCGGIVQLIFLIMHIDQTWKPFAIQIAGILIMLVGSALMPDAAGV